MLILDYDNQFITTEKYDSNCSYKKEDWYFPCIDNQPVYMEGRNGNSNVKHKQQHRLENTFDFLREVKGIKIN